MKNLLQKIKENQFVIIIFALVVVLIISLSGRKTVIEKVKGPAEKGGNITAEQKLMIEIQSLKKELSETKKKLQELQKQKREMSDVRKEKEKKSAVELDRFLERLKGRELSGKEVQSPAEEKKIPVVRDRAPAGIQSPQTFPRIPVEPPGPRLRRIEIIPEKEIKITGKEERIKSESSHDLILPAGSLIDARLTMGVFAPAGERAMPVAGVIKGAALGPNGSYIPIRGCTFVGKAKGNVGYRVAEIQIVRIACVWPDGSVHESEINAYAADTNGMYGVPGRVERFSKEFFATSGVVSFLKGLGEGIARAMETYSERYSDGTTFVTTEVTGSPYVYGIYKGIEEMMDKVQEYYARQNAGLIPAVIVEPGKDISIAVLNGITIKGGRKNVVLFKEEYYDILNTASYVR
jgi:hypothetical protein